ncbi:MAG: hypothetical protein AAF466_14345 [Bacteroidota bacterium]
MKYFFLFLLNALLITPTLAQSETFQGNLPAWYETGTPKKLKRSKGKQLPRTVQFEFHPQKKVTDLEKKGFIWTARIPGEYFEAYLINNTASTLHIDQQDGSLTMIQEALNEDGEWHPIEFWIPSGCGNSYYPLSLKPKQMVLVPIKKYSGDFETQLRLKWKNDEKIFYSAPFLGSINRSQFVKEKETVHGILYHGKARYLDNSN